MTGSLFIATPSYRPEVQAAYMYSMLRTAEIMFRAGAKWTPQIFAGAPVPQARNILTAKFMASGYSHLLFIDSDESWPADAIPRLLAASEHHEVCCAVPPKKTRDLSFPVNFVVADNAPAIHPETGYWNSRTPVLAS